MRTVGRKTWQHLTLNADAAAIWWFLWFGVISVYARRAPFLANDLEGRVIKLSAFILGTDKNISLQEVL